MMINILKQLQQKINAEFKTTEDFAGFNPGKSDMDVEHNDICYEIHYDFEGFKKVKVDVFAFENVPVDGKKRWFSIPIDPFLKGLIEGCFKYMICERFDDLVEIEEEEKRLQDERIQDEIEMMETYRSLEFFR